MIRLKTYKGSNLLLWKIILRKPFTTAATCYLQLPAHSNNGETSHHYLLTITIHCSTLSKLNNFSFCRKQCAATLKPNSLWSYKACNSFCPASRKWSDIKLWSEFQKNWFFRWHSALHWWGEHRNLCRFSLWC